MWYVLKEDRLGEGQWGTCVCEMEGNGIAMGGRKGRVWVGGGET